MINIPVDESTHLILTGSDDEFIRGYRLMHTQTPLLTSSSSLIQNNGNDNLRERSQPQQRSTSHWLSLKPITSWISTIFSSPLSKSQSPQEKSTLEASDEISGKRLDNEYSQIQSTFTLSPNNSSSLSSSLSPVPSSAVRSIQHQRRPKKTSRRSTQKTRHTKDVRIIAYGGNDNNMSSNRGNDANVGLPRPAVGFFEMIRNWFGF